jgi:hypothetical protein
VRTAFLSPVTPRLRPKDLDCSASAYPTRRKQLNHQHAVSYSSEEEIVLIL